MLLAFLIVASIILGAKVTSSAQVYQALPLAWDMLQSRTDVASAIAAGYSEELTEIAGIIATMRIPRTILAMLVGAALGVSRRRDPSLDP